MHKVDQSCLYEHFGWFIFGWKGSDQGQFYGVGVVRFSRRAGWGDHLSLFHSQPGLTTWSLQKWDSQPREGSSVGRSRTAKTNPGNCQRAISSEISRD